MPHDSSSFMVLDFNLFFVGATPVPTMSKSTLDFPDNTCEIAFDKTEPFKS